MTTLIILAPSAFADTTDVPQWAQEKTPIKMSYYLGVGTSVASGDLADSWTLGFHGYGRMDFSASPKLSVWAGAEYHYFSFEDQPDPSVEGANFSSINLTGDLKVNVATPDQGINPYFFGGLGLAIQKISDSTYEIYGDTLVNRGLVSYDTETNALIEIGGGVEFNEFFIQGRFVNIFASGSSISYIPFTVGVKF